MDVEFVYNRSIFYIFSNCVFLNDAMFDILLKWYIDMIWMPLNVSMLSILYQYIVLYLFEMQSFYASFADKIRNFGIILNNVSKLHHDYINYGIHVKNGLSTWNKLTNIFLQQIKFVDAILVLKCEYLDKTYSAHQTEYLG